MDGHADAASIVDPQDKVTVDEGGDALLECRATGNPLTTTTVHWRREGFNMETRTEQTSDVGVAYLTVKQVTRDDTGAFECVASNGIGQESVAKTWIIAKCTSLTVLLFNVACKQQDTSYSYTCVSEITSVRFDLNKFHRCVHLDINCRQQRPLVTELSVRYSGFQISRWWTSRPSTAKRPATRVSGPNWCAVPTAHPTSTSLGRARALTCASATSTK